MPDRKGLMAVTPWRSLAWALAQLQQGASGRLALLRKQQPRAGGWLMESPSQRRMGVSPMVSWEQGLKADAPGAGGKCAPS